MVSELIEDGIMKQILDVLGVVEGRRSSGSFGCFLLVARFAGVNALVDAQPSEIWKGNLKFADSLCTGDEILRLARRACRT